MKKKNTIWVAATVACLLLASCGTTKNATGTGQAAAGDKTAQVQKATQKAGDAAQTGSARELAFVQKVADNQVYAKNIVGSMSFNLQAAGKDITVPGKLSMRKDEVIRIQLFIPILGSEVGRLEFTPDYVLIIDRLHKEYIKADYTQVDFLKKQGVNFYSLQALFWNELLVPGVKKVAASDLQKFTAQLDGLGDQVPVTIQYGNIRYSWSADRNSGRITEATAVYRDGGAGESKLNLKYADFKSVGVKMFPATQHLTFSTWLDNKQQEAKMNIEMKSVKTDSKWESQTEVSSKYKQIAPQDVLGKLLNM